MEMIFMPSMDVEAYEVKTKVSDRQLEFLENRAKELGLSKEELLRWYVISDMVKVVDDRQKIVKAEKKQFSLEGIISGSTVTDEDFEEAKKIWIPKSP
jgi:hypothetical protein